MSKIYSSLFGPFINPVVKCIFIAWKAFISRNRCLPKLCSILRASVKFGENSKKVCDEYNVLVEGHCTAINSHVLYYALIYFVSTDMTNDGFASMLFSQTLKSIVIDEQWNTDCNHSFKKLTSFLSVVNICLN